MSESMRYEYMWHIVVSLDVQTWTDVEYTTIDTPQPARIVV